MSAKTRSANIGSVKKKIKSDMLLFEPFTWTDKQKELISIMEDYHTNAVFVEGPAGTGKSVCAMYSALQLLTHNKVEKIVYIRSVVESSQAHLGYLPGDKDAKVHEWFQTAFEACSNFISESELQDLVKAGKLEFAPISFLRGRNFKNCVIIVEECQNISYKEHLTILTRCADNCRIFLMGDSYQTDIKEKDQFRKVYEKLSDDDSIAHHIFVRTFGPEDIRRSELVKFLVEKLDIYKVPS
jgi:phosphate starvation-inducible PhoH-like protein